MAEYIEREAAMQAVRHAWGKGLEPSQYIEIIPAAEVAPVMHGRWEYTPQTINTLSRFKCSVCGWWTLDPSVDGAYNYCPNCGARMDGDS